MHMIAQHTATGFRQTRGECVAVWGRVQVHTGGTALLPGDMFAQISAAALGHDMVEIPQHTGS